SGEFFRAFSDMQARRYREAAATLEELSSSGRASYWTWMELGTAYLRLHRYEPAADAFLAAGAIGPDSPWPIYYRGVALLAAGRIEQSVTALDRFIERKPKVPKAWLSRAQAHYRLNKSKEALNDLKEADRLGASPTRVHGLAEMCWRAAGRTD